jgi:ABC-type dipeptide/oligopeptide/nickel transport system permease subunit
MSFKLVGLIIVAFYIIMAVFGPQMVPFNPSARVGPPFSPPGGVFRLGTNDMGNDLFSELIVATRSSLFIGLLSGLIGIFLSVTIGLISGWFADRPVGLLLNQFTVFFLTLPIIPLVITLAVFLPGGPLTTSLILGFTLWPASARILRSLSLSIKESSSISSLRAMGADALYLIRRHAFRILWPYIFMQFITKVRSAILAESALCFMGLGSSTVKSWGTMLYYAQARNAILTEAWSGWIIPPGLMIATLCLGLTLIGYGLEHEFDRRLEQ